jgi:hypothetical protein
MRMVVGFVRKKGRGLLVFGQEEEEESRGKRELLSFISFNFLMKCLKKFSQKILVSSFQLMKFLT